MDILENLYRIKEILNKNSGTFSNFILSRSNSFDYTIDYLYEYHDKKEDKKIIKNVKNLYFTKDLKIFTNYKSLDDAVFLEKEVGFDCLFEIEKIISDYNELDIKSKTQNLYILKANFSSSVLMEKKTKHSKVYELLNIYGDIENSHNFLFTLDEVKYIENNPNIIYDCYIVKLNDVLEDYDEKTFNIDYMYRFSKDKVINTKLFEPEESVDYYNTVLRIKRLIENRIDSYENKVSWIDNLLVINKKFILEFYETHIGYDLTSLADKELQKDLLEIIKSYNDFSHKVTSKYVVINKKENYFLQAKKTPIGETYITPLKPKHIAEFDENCIFYLEELNEKLSDNLLSELYSKDSKYEIILWDKIDDYREQLFGMFTDSQYASIINRLNSISKRVV